MLSQGIIFRSCWIRWQRCSQKKSSTLRIIVHGQATKRYLTVMQPVTGKAFLPGKGTRRGNTAVRLSTLQIAENVCDFCNVIEPTELGAPIVYYGASRTRQYLASVEYGEKTRKYCFIGMRSGVPCCAVFLRFSPHSTIAKCCLVRLTP